MLLTRATAVVERCLSRRAIHSTRNYRPLYCPPPLRAASLKVPVPRVFSTSSRVPAIHYVQFGGKKPNSSSNAQIYLSGAVVIIGGIYYVSHLEQVPETGRWRFMHMSPQLEARYADEMFRQIMKNHGSKMLPPSHPVSQRVTAVARRVLQASGLGHIRGEPISATEGSMDVLEQDERLRVNAPSGQTTNIEKEWTVHVVVSDEANAFATFGGHIVVFTGILPICKDEDGLAAVVSHEIAHVVARHSAERLSSLSVITWVVRVLEYIAFLPPLVSGVTVMALFELPNSRTQEYEADRIGLKLMARACFDPRGSPEMFARLGDGHNDNGLLKFLRTHPVTRSRVEKLEERLPEAYAAQAEHGLCGDTARQLDVFSRTVGLPSPPSVRGRGGGHGSGGGGGWKAGDSSEFVPETPDRSSSGEIVWR